MLAAFGLLAAPQAHAQNAQGNTYVKLRDGQLRVFPNALLQRTDTVDGMVRFHLSADAAPELTKSYALAQIESIGQQAPSDLPFPRFTSWKINNKFNPNVHTDATGTISTDGREVSITIPSIDRTVIPSFQFSDADAAAGAKAYIDTVRQESKVSLVRFDAPVTYTLAYPNHVRYAVAQIAAAQSAIEPGEQVVHTPIKLTTDNLTDTYGSTAAGEGLASLLDNNPNTNYSSYWGANLAPSISPEIHIELNEGIDEFSLYYMTRGQMSSAGGYNLPLEIEVQVSANGVTWTKLRTLTAADGMPTSGLNVEYTSPVIKSSMAFTHIKLRCTRSSYKNYFSLAALGINTIERNYHPGQPAQPAKYAIQAYPYGTPVTVTATFPTQSATRIPRIDIDLAQGVTLQEVIRAKGTADEYRRAKVTIDGAGVWPSMSDSASFKGRGNSTWSMNKKPYRIKFDKSQKPFGLTKGKSWVLLANALGNGTAQLNNAVAMKTAQLVGTAAVNHIVPVMLYVNGQNLGLYNFTEQVGISNNSVNLPSDSTGVLLELDTYKDEDPYFSAAGFERVKYKDPDPEDYEADFGKEAFTLFDSRVQDEFNRLGNSIWTGNYPSLIDVPSLCRYFMVNDLIGNLEFGHPKSTYLHRTDIFSPDDKWVFGPVWDCDWAYGYEQSRQFASVPVNFDVFDVAPKGTGRDFFEALMHSSEEVRREYFATWHRFINDGGLDALGRFVDDYYAYTRTALRDDQYINFNGQTDMGIIATRLRNWVTNRAKYIYSQLETFPIVTSIERAPIVDDRQEREDLYEAREAARRVGVSTLRQGVFTLDGRRIDRPASQLPQGIYIINGQKTVVR